MSRTTPLTPDQVKARLRRSGTTITEWAIANGFTRRQVYRVLNGVAKGHYGRAHEIAVALNLKVPLVEPSTDAGTRNRQSQAAA